MARRRRALAAVTAGAALLTTLAVGTSSAVARPAAGDPGRSAARLATGLAWQPCADDDLDSAGAVCATFHVPLDYKQARTARRSRSPCRW